MLHINHQQKYKDIYMLVRHVYSAPTESMLNFNVGMMAGWTSAKFPTEFGIEELARLDILVQNLEMQKQREFDKKHGSINLIYNS